MTNLAAHGFWSAIKLIPEDVQHLAPSVLCHRLSLSAEARMRGYTNEQAFAEILSGVRIPVRLK